MRKALSLMAFWMALNVSGSAAYAKDPVTLKIGDYMAANHYIVDAGLKPWMEEITTATKGAVKFQYYPSQQLGKANDLFRLTQANVAQVASLFSSQAGDKLELSGAAELPGLFTTSCQGTTAYLNAAKSGPIADIDFKANGVHLLYGFVFRPYQLFTLSRPVHMTADLKGLKTMIPMRSTELMFNKMSAVSMKLISGADTYQAAQKGIIDAFLLNPESLYIYDLQSLTRHATENGNFGQLVSVYVINLKTWNSLDDATKAIITAASEKAAVRTCQAIDKGYLKAIERMRKDKIDVVSLLPDTLKELSKASDDAAVEWTNGLEARGKPAKQVLDLIRKTTQSVASR